MLRTSNECSVGRFHIIEFVALKPVENACWLMQEFYVLDNDLESTE